MLVALLFLGSGATPGTAKDIAPADLEQDVPSIAGMMQQRDMFQRLLEDVRRTEGLSKNPGGSERAKDLRKRIQDLENEIDRRRAARWVQFLYDLLTRPTEPPAERPFVL